MYETSDFRKGLRVEIDGQPYIIVENQFVKPGKGQAFSRVKLKNLLQGNVIDRTYKSGEKVAQADIVEKAMQFLYINDETYHFMDNSDFEQFELLNLNILNIVFLFSHKPLNDFESHLFYHQFF